MALFGIPLLLANGECGGGYHPPPGPSQDAGPSNETCECDADCAPDEHCELIERWSLGDGHETGGPKHDEGGHGGHAPPTGVCVPDGETPPPPCECPGPGGPGSSCEDESDCEAELVCSDGGICVEVPGGPGDECELDADCEDGLICGDDDTCRDVPGGPEDECDEDADCNEVLGFECGDDGTCVNPPNGPGEECDDDEDCDGALDLACIDDVCTDIPGGPGDACEDDDDCQPVRYLGSAADFAVLAGSTVTNTNPTTIEGNLGVSPGSAVTGFPPGIVTDGVIHAMDPVAAQAQADLTTAYITLAGEACGDDRTDQDLAGLTLTRGVYCYSSSAELNGTLTLDAEGDPDAVFIFQIGSTLTTGSGAAVELINGAQPCNVYWQVGSSATLGTGTDFIGNIVALTSITVTTGTEIIGRALARNGAVTMNDNHIEAGSCDTGDLTCEENVCVEGGTGLLGGLGGLLGGLGSTCDESSDCDVSLGLGCIANVCVDLGTDDGGCSPSNCLGLCVLDVCVGL